MAKAEAQMFVAPRNDVVFAFRALNLSFNTTAQRWSQRGMREANDGLQKARVSQGLVSSEAVHYSQSYTQLLSRNDIC